MNLSHNIWFHKAFIYNLQISNSMLIAFTKYIYISLQILFDSLGLLTHLY